MTAHPFQPRGPTKCLKCRGPKLRAAGGICAPCYEMVTGNLPPFPPLAVMLAVTILRTQS